MHGSVITLGFKRSTSDPGLYSKGASKGVQYVTACVDDVLISDKDENEIKNTADGLEEIFELTKLEE